MFSILYANRCLKCLKDTLKYIISYGAGLYILKNFDIKLCAILCQVNIPDNLMTW